MTRRIHISNSCELWYRCRRSVQETRSGGTAVSQPERDDGASLTQLAIDVIHAVEPKHNGGNDAAVMYIPAVALTARNAEYVRDQRATFTSGRPPPDFPGGVGESQFVTRGQAEDLRDQSSRIRYSTS